MSEIAVGDRIRPSYMPERHVGKGWEVIAIQDDRAWAQFIEPDGRIRDDIFLLMNIIKIQPRFEVGKQYTVTDPTVSSRTDFPVTIASANEEWAIGWWADGSPWHRRHCILGATWQEVR